ncbi:MAG TPA: LPS export ABC transporter periplasmic protein LptC [Candidatus Omnitrophica bacterium]|nr:LPS export ABC transporter periplasmic protein LptC [Candidatus Omnitrophota bacterium]
MRKLLIFIFLFFLVALGIEVPYRAQASQDVIDVDDSSNQQILEFDLSGFGDKGKKTWNVKGKSADIFGDTVRLEDINARVYGEEDNVDLTADTGAYNKAEGTIHLEDNVVVTTESGARLVTDSLDWNQESQKVTTEDDVDITKENIKVSGKGIEAKPSLKKVRLNRDIRVDIKDTDFSLTPSEIGQSDKKESQPVTITCDGSLDVDYEKQIATFIKNVKVIYSQGQIHADKMVVTFDMKGKQIEKVESYGNVKIINGENTTYSQEAVYTAKDKRIVLTGRPRLIIYSNSSMSFME